MRVCFFNSGYPPDRGGVATWSGGLAQHMAEHPQVERVGVVAFKNYSGPRREKREKLNIFRYRHKHPALIGFGILMNCFRFRKFDVFHATNIFPVGFFTLVFGKYVFRKRVFVTIHGTDVLSTSASAFTRAAIKFVLEHCDRVLPNSISTSSRTAERYGLQKNLFTVIYPGVDPQPPSGKDIRAEHGIAPDDFLVLAGGQLIKRKGFDDIIRLFATIQDPTVKLLIFSTGPEESKLKQLVRELNLDDRAKLVGKVGNITDYYQAADVFVMASKYLKEEGDIEGLGFVAIEAQVSGLPVISTDSGGVAESVENGVSGYKVAEGDFIHIAELIKKLQTDPDLRKRLGEAARDFARQRFDWKQSVREHLQAYQAAVK